MSVSIYRVRDEFNAANHQEYLMDSDSDVSALPGLETCAAGSTALAMLSGNLYILTHVGTWILFSNGGSGSGGSGDSIIKSVDTTHFTVDADGKLTLNEIPIDKVDGLEAALDNRVEKIDGKGLSTNDFTDEMKNALVSIIEGNGIATDSIPGVVLSSSAENCVSVNPDTGVMEVNSVNINKLVQSDDDELVFNGGNAG